MFVAERYVKHHLLSLMVQYIVRAVVSVPYHALVSCEVALSLAFLSVSADELSQADVFSVFGPTLVIDHVILPNVYGGRE